jgi:NTE family protein
VLSHESNPDRLTFADGPCARLPSRGIVEDDMEVNGNGRKPRVAVVLPGGGTRGAYEAGALSVLLPALEARGEEVTIACGTSVGAINTGRLAATAHLPAVEQGESHMDTWRAIRRRDVLSPLVSPALPLRALQMLGNLLDLPGPRLASVLDPSPMQGSLERWIDWDDLHRNVRTGVMESVCVVATSLSAGGPVAFVERTRRRAGTAAPPMPSSEEIRYVRTTLGPEHVRASAAIPVLFPPVDVDMPRAAAGSYIDGGTRLNSPIKPAIQLGADRVIVIGFEPLTRGAPAAPRPETPALADVMANVLDGLLVDQVASDLSRMAAVNQFFVAEQGGATGYRSSRGRAPYRRISYALVCPEEKGEIGALAEDVFQRRHGGWKGLRDIDFALMSRALGSRARSRGELLSFLFFDPVFVEELMELGQRDANRWLARHPNMWCSDRDHDFPVDHGGLAVAREQAAVSEFRDHARTRLR